MLVKNYLSYEVGGQGECDVAGHGVEDRGREEYALVGDRRERDENIASEYQFRVLRSRT